MTALFLVSLFCTIGFCILAFGVSVSSIMETDEKKISKSLNRIFAFLLSAFLCLVVLNFSFEKVAIAEAEKVRPTNYSVNVSEMVKHDGSDVEDLLNLVYLQKADEVQIKETNNYEDFIICVSDEAGNEKNIIMGPFTIDNMIDVGALTEIK